MIGNTPLVREWTGALWAEGPAWNGVGPIRGVQRHPQQRQMRWDEVTGKVTPFRTPSNFSNGNTFDWQGRQISCEHQTARVVRYEYQGEPTMLATTFEGKRLNAPNDVIVHPEGGGILFTDPGLRQPLVLRRQRPRARAADQRLPHRRAERPPHQADRRDQEAERRCASLPTIALSTSPTRRRRTSRREGQDHRVGPSRTTAAASPSAAIRRRWMRASTTASAPTSMATSGAAPDSAERASTASTSTRRTARNRPDRDARGNRQPVLRRQEPQSPVHDEQPVGLHALHCSPGRAHYLAGC